MKKFDWLIVKSSDYEDEIFSYEMNRTVVDAMRELEFVRASLPSRTFKLYRELDRSDY